MSRELDVSDLSGGRTRVRLPAARGQAVVVPLKAAASEERFVPLLPGVGLALGFFLLLLLAGWLAFSSPGVLETGRLSAIDALLLAASAVTLTGLSAVPVTELSAQGQTLLLVLFQVAGIAVIAFSSMCLVAPGICHARGSRQVVRQRWLQVEQISPGRVLLQVVLVALALEAVGALVLYLRLRAGGVPRAPFSALYLSASAFCNAGFVPGGPAAGVLAADGVAVVTLLVLVSLGGLGYVVLRDLGLRLTGTKTYLELHTRIVLAGGLVLTVLASGLLLLLGGRAAAAGGAGAGRLLGTVFQAIDARGAGFALSGPARSPAAKVITVALMLVGGAPGSAAGGLKVTTVCLALFIGLRGMGSAGDGLRLLGRRAPVEAVRFAAVFLLRALLLLACAVLLLSITEALFARQEGPAFGNVLFEAVSAFTAAGLSTGLTPALSAPGKVVLVLSMLAGRFGLLVVALRTLRACSGPSFRHSRAAVRQGEVYFG